MHKVMYIKKHLILTLSKVKLLINLKLVYKIIDKLKDHN